MVGGLWGSVKNVFIDLILNIFYYWVDMCLVWTVNSQQQLLNCVAVPSDSDCKIRERSDEPVMSSSSPLNSNVLILSGWTGRTAT